MRLDPRLPSRCPAVCTLAVLAGLWLAGAAAFAQESPCAELEPGPARSVSRVIDGETLALDDGTELRLVGALAPRATDVGAEPGTWPMEWAAREELRALLVGKSIALRFGGDRADRYGRLQAHAFLVEGEGRRWVQGHMLERGFARAYAQAGNRACSAEMLAADSAAREALRGLWADAAYGVRRADAPTELLRYRATFQIVEGRIVRVALVRSVIYLNFDRNWRRGFSVSLRRGDGRALLGDHSGNPKQLEGRIVRVRGWIERRNAAPVIDLSAGGLIEIVTVQPPAESR